MSAGIVIPDVLRQARPYIQDVDKGLKKTVEASERVYESSPSAANDT